MKSGTSTSPVDHHRSVLLADHDAAEAAEISRAFEREGFDVDVDDRFEHALDRIGAKEFSIIVLDLGLADVRGLDALKEMRSASSAPLVVIDGSGDESDLVLGLELGADDYLHRPCFPREVVARSKAILRRSGEGSPSPEPTGRVVLDHRSHQVLVEGRPVTLTAREFELLRFLAADPGRVYSPEELMLEVWGATDQWQSPTTVREHIFRLRQKIEIDPTDPHHLVTVRRVGYRFDP